MSEDYIKSRAVFQLEGLINLFLRVLAIVFICFAIRYWLMVVGVLDENVRFDTMPNHWKVASTFLSVFYPVAALGLWELSRWGIILWFLTAGLELGMHVLYPQLYGINSTLIIFHLASFGVWILYALIEFLDKKRALIKANK